MSKKSICLRIALTSGIVAAAVAVIIYAELIHLLNVVSTHCRWPTVGNSATNDGKFICQFFLGDFCKMFE